MIKKSVEEVRFTSLAMVFCMVLMCTNSDVVLIVSVSRLTRNRIKVKSVGQTKLSTLTESIHINLIVWKLSIVLLLNRIVKTEINAMIIR